MTIAINSSTVSNGILTIDATVTANAGHKIRSFFITCGGEQAYYLIPRRYYVSNTSSYTEPLQNITAGRSVSRIPLAQWPNGELAFIVSAKYQNTTTGVTVTESSPVTVTVTNTDYQAPQAHDPIVQPEGQLQQPVITVFDVPATTEQPTIPVTLSAKDNNAVTGYFLSEFPTTPLADDPAWAANPTEYTILGAGTVPLYAWAKDAEGNISEPVSATVSTVGPVAAEVGSVSAAGSAQPILASAVSYATAACGAVVAQGAATPTTAQSAAYVIAAIGCGFARGSAAPIVAGSGTEADLSPAEAVGSCSPVSADFTRCVAAEVASANAEGRASPIAAAVTGTSPDLALFVTLKGKDGASYPMYIKGGSQTGIRFAA